MGTHEVYGITDEKVKDLMRIQAELEDEMARLAATTTDRPLPDAVQGKVETLLSRHRATEVLIAERRAEISSDPEDVTRATEMRRRLR